jgi:hypothetical protein
MMSALRRTGLKVLTPRLPQHITPVFEPGLARFRADFTNLGGKVVNIYSAAHQRNSTGPLLASPQAAFLVLLAAAARAWIIAADLWGAGQTRRRPEIRHSNIRPKATRYRQQRRRRCATE